MPVVIVDGKEIEIPADRKMNAIEAAALAGVEIPHYCWHPGLSVVGSCRMCLIEMGNRNPETGEISMLPKLFPACNTPAKDGLVIVTQSEKVQRARAMVEEDLLLRHPIDCPICDKAGECRLQDYHFAHGREQRRADVRPFTSRKRDLGDVFLFVDRCVMCSRCVRFSREISGTSELMISRRGANEEIDVLPDYPLNNKLSGNVVDLCPVGALADKDFLYKQRVWFLKRRPGVCTGCATGCSIWVEQNQDRVWRIKPRENPFVNKWWICNDGRYGYPHVHDPRRLRGVAARGEEGPVPIDWKAFLSEVPEKLKAAGNAAVVLSPFLTVEEAYLLARWMRSLDANATVAVGPVPVEGEDETFPGGFVIAAEKCPNRRGVEAVASYFQKGVVAWSQFLEQAAAGKFGAVWVAGGYPKPWLDETEAASLRKAALLIVQDLFPTPASAVADYVLASAAFPEREGAYVNRGDRLQRVVRAIRPPAGNRPAAQVVWELLGREGLYDARAVLSEIAAEINYFAAAAGDIPETGLDLKVNMLADAGSGTHA
ncbi:MAG: ferredoxin [Planctomycetota bacterium]|nr:MAG: ferredoxin [Planctomycetota bacterium]